MEIDLEIYSHLVKSGILEGGINSPNHKVLLDLRKVIFDKETSIIFENGIAFARYMIYIKRRLESQDDQQSRVNFKIDEEKLTQLRTSVTPSIRLHNWNIIIKELMKIGMKVNADMKSLLVAGDYGIINDYLVALYNFEMNQSGGQQVDINQSFNPNKSVDKDQSYLSQIQGGQEGSVDIGDMDYQKRPNETTTCLEFLLNVICKAFNMIPKQAAGLLTNANKYLNIAIVKGLKNEYEPVISLYQETYAHSKHLTQLIEHEHSFNLSTNTLGLILNAYKSGFLSQNDEVVSWCCRLFAKIAYDFVDAGEIIGVAWDWFKDETQGALETCIQALKKHQYILDGMIPVFANFARYNFAELFTHHFRKFTPLLCDYFNLIHEMIGPLNESKFSRDELKHTGTLDFFIELCISKGDTNNGAIDTTKNDREAAICLLCTLWSMFQDKFDKPMDNFDFEGQQRARVFMHLRNTQTQEPQTLGQITLTILKRNCRDKSQIVRMTAISQLFRLLDQFSSERNQYAPVLFKTLIFSLIENHSNELVRAHIMSNFQFTFERITTIPVGILVDPLVKQIYMSEGITFKFNVFDFDFFTQLSKHPRLNIKNAIQIADLMAKAYLNENAIDFQNSASVSLMLVVTRFLDHSATQEFIVKFVTVALTMLSQIEKEMSDKNAERREKIQEFEREMEEQKKKQKVPRRKWPPEITIEEKLNPPEETSDEVELRAKQLIRRHRIVDIIKQLIKYRNQDLNDEVKVVLLSALQKHLENYQEESKGIVHILDWWWGQPQKLLADFIKKQKEDEARRERDQENQSQYGMDIERQYQSQYDIGRSETDSYTNIMPIPKQKTVKEEGIIQKKQDKSIMLKDIVKQTNQAQINTGKQLNKNQSQQNLKTPAPPKNEFLAILEKSKEENEPKIVPKKNTKAVQKTLHLNDDEDDEIGYGKRLGNSKINKSVAISMKEKAPFPDGYNQSRNQSIFPPIPYTKQNKNLDRSYDSPDDMSSARHQKPKSNKKLTYSKTKAISDTASIDDNYYKYLKFQQQQMTKGGKGSKSTNNLKQEERQMIQALPYDNFLKSKNVSVAALRKQPRDRKVMLEIEKLNQKKQDKEYKKYLDEQVKDFRDQRQKQKLKQALERRKLELGIAPTVKKKPNNNSKSRGQTRASRRRWNSEDPGRMNNQEDEDSESEREANRDRPKLDVLILDEGERIPSTKEKLRKVMPVMQLIDINTQEEERDRMQINLWMNKHSRLFKYLFNKYANTIRSNVEQNFDFKDQKSKQMNLAEIFKFTKDHNIINELLSKDEIQSLVRLINLKRKRTEDVTNMDLEAFTNFYIQMANNIFYLKQLKVKMSVVEQLDNLLKHMQKAILYKGENVQIYDDPDFVVGQDRARLRQLNKDLQNDPSVEVPEGFYKVYEKEQFFDYSLPDYLPVPESKKIAVETLDSMIFDIFGIHFLEARAFTMVVPKIKQEQKIVQGKHKKNLDELKTFNRTQAQTRVPQSNNVAISDSLKQEVEKLQEIYPKEDLDQVAFTLELLLQKIDPKTSNNQATQNYKTNPFAQKDQIVNKIQQDKLKKQLEDEKVQNEREMRRLKHERELRQKMQILQQEKEGKDYDKTRTVKDQEYHENDKKRRKDEERQREIMQKKQALEEKKARDREEQIRIQEEENERRRKENEFKAKQQKEFLKAQKEKIAKGLETQIKDRKQLVEVQQQVEKEFEQKKNKIKSNMVEYLGKTKDERKREDEKQKEEINQFMGDQQTLQTFKRYNKGLQQYYKYFATQDKQTIEFALEAKNETINMSKFVKFGYQSNIYPALISHEDLLHIFRHLVRDRLEVKNESKILKDKLSAEEIEKLHVIDFEYFKRSLVMISALAQDRLTGKVSTNLTSPLKQTIEQRVQSRSQQFRKPQGGLNDSKLETQSKFNKDTSLNRKTKEVREIKLLKDHAPKYDTKIEDIQVAKHLRIDSLTPKILENLFLFMEINEGDTATKVSNKIHNTRLEIAGQKPTKLKMEEVKKIENIKRQ
eukprot:403354173